MTQLTCNKVADVQLARKSFDDGVPHYLSLLGCVSVLPIPKPRKKWHMLTTSEKAQFSSPS
jgi:hypothetical protein